MTTDEEIDLVIKKLEELRPEHEGLRDYARLNLQPATMTYVQEMLQKYDRRYALLNAVIFAFENLKNQTNVLFEDGHPDLPIKEIPSSAFEDLQENELTIEAALKKFSSDQAVGFIINAGEPKLK